MIDDDRICKPITNTFHQIHLFRRQIFTTPKVYRWDDADRGRKGVAQVTVVGSGQARFQPGFARAWEPHIPLSSASRLEEGALPHLLSSPSSPARTHCLPASPAPAPKASLLFLDPMLVCHNPCSSRVVFSWPSNRLPEPPAATNTFAPWL